MRDLAYLFPVKCISETSELARTPRNQSTRTSGQKQSPERSLAQRIHFPREHPRLENTLAQRTPSLREYIQPESTFGQRTPSPKEHPLLSGSLSSFSLHKHLCQSSTKIWKILKNNLLWTIVCILYLLKNLWKVTYLGLQSDDLYRIYFLQPRFWNFSLTLD